MLAPGPLSATCSRTSWPSRSSSAAASSRSSSVGRQSGVASVAPAAARSVGHVMRPARTRLVLRTMCGPMAEARRSSSEKETPGTAASVA
eukprot:2584721-Pyramimonas_sp.AAC.1